MYIIPIKSPDPSLPFTDEGRQAAGGEVLGPGHVAQRVSTRALVSPEPLGHLSTLPGEQEFVKHFQILILLAVKSSEGKLHAVAKNKCFR